MTDYYPYYSKLWKISINNGNEIENRAIANSRIALFPSQWAAHSAINDYSAEKSKVHIIPFGANIDNVPQKELILQKKKTNKCRLLFLGVKWDRKRRRYCFRYLYIVEQIRNRYRAVCLWMHSSHKIFSPQNESNSLYQ